VLQVADSTSSAEVASASTDRARAAGLLAPRGAKQGQPRTVVAGGKTAQHSGYSDLPPLAATTRQCPRCRSWIDATAETCIHCRDFETADDESSDAERAAEKFNTTDVCAAALRLARSYGWKGLALLASASAALLIIAAAIVVIEVLVRQLAREAAGYSESTSIASWLLRGLQLGLSVLGICVLLGLTRMTLVMVRGKRPEIVDLVRDRVLAVRFLLNVLGFGVVIDIGLSWWVLPGLVATLLLWPVVFVAADETQRGWFAFGRAFAIGKANWVRSLGLALVACALHFFSFGIGLPLTLSAQCLLFAVAYFRATEQSIVTADGLTVEYSSQPANEIPQTKAPRMPRGPIPSARRRLEDVPTGNEPKPWGRIVRLLLVFVPFLVLIGRPYYVATRQGELPGTQQWELFMPTLIDTAAGLVVFLLVFSIIAFVVRVVRRAIE
jgi:hypothetical protein